MVCQEETTNLGEKGWPETGPRAGAWWLPRREKPTHVGAWIAFCWRFFLWWVDRAEEIPKVGSPIENNVAKKVVGKSFRQSR